MTIGELIKRYRAENAMSQKELASLMHTTDMTISRIESGKNFRLTSEMTDALLKMFTKEIIFSVDDTPQAKQLRRSFPPPKRKQEDRNNDLEPSLINWRSSQNNERLFLPENRKFLDEQMHTIGFLWEFLPNSLMPHISIDFAYCNAVQDKIWCFDYRIFQSVINVDNLFSQILYTAGKVPFFKDINKLSIITQAEISTQLYEKFHLVLLDKVNCDISILHYNSEKHRIDSELELAFYKDGRGIFDLDVPEKEDESARLYSNWILSLKGS